MIFINTRPTQRAKTLTDFLQSQGVEVLDLPLLELIACELSQTERQCLQNINTYQAVVFVSETAVSYFFDYIQTHQISLNPNLNFIAVGQKTAQFFRQCWQKNYSTSPNLLKPSDFNLAENNEGLLQLPIIQTLKKDSQILILKGKDGRDLLKNTLLEKGVTVDKVDFYQRIFPSTSKTIFQDFCQSDGFSSQKTVLITSLTAWQHWQALVQDSFDIADFDYIVLQNRIAAVIKQDFKGVRLLIVDNLKPHSILQILNG